MNGSPPISAVFLYLFFTFFVMAEDNKEFRLLQDEKVPTKQAAEQRKISPRDEWPELVGLDAAEAEKRIKEDTPGIDIVVVPPGYCVTMDHVLGRVRLYIDSSKKVAKPPRIG